MFSYITVLQNVFKAKNYRKAQSYLGLTNMRETNYPSS